MPRGNARRDYAESTLREYARQNALTPDDLSPRVKLALRLYVHGVVPTQRAAAEAAGLHYMTFNSLINSPAGKQYMQTAHQIIEEQAHDTSKLINALSHRAIQVLGGLMEDSGKDEVRFRAAQDLADRGSETAKIHKHQVESFTLASTDARALAEAVVMAAAVRQQNAQLKTENFDRVNLDEVNEVEVEVKPVQLTLLKE